MLGDTVKGKKMTGVSDKVREGVLLHRRIDIYTDSHPEIANLVHLFRPVLGRFSPIAVDVILDHFLAKDWLNYAPISLDHFVHVLFKSFEGIETDLPDRTKWLGTLMQERGWLLQYQSLVGLEDILVQMSRRLENRVKLFEAIPFLRLNYEEVQGRFGSFFYQLKQEFPPDWIHDPRFTK